MASVAEEVTMLVKTQYQNRTLSDLLRQPTIALLGVSNEASNALKLLEILSIFDLATSEVFAGASKLLEAGLSTKSILYQHGSPAADLVREEDIQGVRIDQLRDSKIKILARVPKESAETISIALGVTNIRELVLYPPYRAALRILNVVYFPENLSVFNSEEPADLLPKNGEYPTERVQYTTLVMDEIKIGDVDHKIDLGGDDFTPLDLSKLSAGDAGFQNIAYGALITIGQSWFGQGVTLGHLLHSVSLAPGESTRIAMVDWTRKSRAGQTEVIQEEDQLDAASEHNRAMNEVTAANARDAQSGFSQTHQNSSSEAAAVAASADASFGFGSASISASYNTANTSAAADSYSTSSGSRDLASQMTQNVNDRTHQNAHSTRSRRAAVVKEVSQTEHEGISTRVLANYNHMHALTIQYYEVVQIYKTKVSIAKVDKVIFIPVKLFDFTDDSLIHRFRSVLARASPTAEIREAIQNLDVVELAPVPDTRFTWLGGNLLSNVVNNPARWYNASFLAQTTGAPLQSDAAPATGGAAPDTDPPTKFKSRVTLHNQAAFKAALTDTLWNKSDQTSRISGFFNRPILRAGSRSIFLPSDVAIVGSSTDSENVPITLSFSLVGGGSRAASEVTTQSPLALTDVSELTVNATSHDRDFSVQIQLALSRSGVQFPVDVPAVTVPQDATGPIRILTAKTGGVNANVKKFLSENRQYYSTAVLRSLDATQLALLLSGYVVRIKESKVNTDSGEFTSERLVPISQVIEPRPIRYVGNYLAFKMTTGDSDPDWADWLALRKLKVGYTVEDIVPLPSGGTFAEAVLGRYNCAEKLDITRFWNWQDSPIPLQPSDIAAIQAGKHDTSDRIATGQLSNPIINMTAPTSLPDPTGTSAVLSAIQNGNMFRDMSGLLGTISLAQSATHEAQAGATSAGQQAVENMSNLLKASTERQRIAADTTKSLASTAASVYTAGGSGVGASNHSQDGAKINYFDKTAKGAAPGANTSSSPDAGENSIGGGNGSNMTAEAQDAGPTFTQNPAALAATWGDGAPRSNMFQNVVDKMPVGKLEPTDITNLADGDGLQDLYFSPPSLSYTKDTHSQVNSSFVLGTNPHDAFNNAVDIKSHNSLHPLQVSDKRYVKHSKFAWKQFAQQRSYQKVSGVWTKVYQDREAVPDTMPGSSEAGRPDPMLSVYDQTRGWLYMFDSPGFPPVVTSAHTGSWDMGGGIKSSETATEVVVKMLFYTHVEGMPRITWSGGTKPPVAWEQISETLQWLSVQWLKRNSPTAPWTSVVGATKILEGDPALTEFLRFPGDREL